MERIFFTSYTTSEVFSSPQWPSCYKMTHHKTTTLRVFFNNFFKLQKFQSPIEIEDSKAWMDLLDKHPHQGSSFCVIFPFSFDSHNWYSDGFVCMHLHWVNINYFWNPLVLAWWLTSLADVNLARRWLSTYLVWHPLNSKPPTLPFVDFTENNILHMGRIWHLPVKSLETFISIFFYFKYYFKHLSCFEHLSS